MLGHHSIKLKLPELQTKHISLKHVFRHCIKAAHWSWGICGSADYNSESLPAQLHYCCVGRPIYRIHIWWIGLCPNMPMPAPSNGACIAAGLHGQRLGLHPEWNASQENYPCVGQFWYVIGMQRLGRWGISLKPADVHQNQATARRHVLRLSRHASTVSAHLLPHNKWVSHSRYEALGAEHMGSTLAWPAMYYMNRNHFY
jgi:hypothetical protein